MNENQTQSDDRPPYLDNASTLSVQLGHPAPSCHHTNAGVQLGLREAGIICTIYDCTMGSQSYPCLQDLVYLHETIRRIYQAKGMVRQGLI
jgi:hypothetical protein